MKKESKAAKQGPRTLKKHLKPTKKVIKQPKQPTLRHIHLLFVTYSLLKLSGLSGLSRNTFRGFRLRRFTTHKRPKIHHNNTSVITHHIQKNREHKETNLFRILMEPEVIINSTTYPTVHDLLQKLLFFLRW